VSKAYRWNHAAGVGASPEGWSTEAGGLASRYAITATHPSKTARDAIRRWDRRRGGGASGRSTIRCSDALQMTVSPIWERLSRERRDTARSIAIAALTEKF
jgi:hypothetical protein